VDALVVASDGWADFCADKPWSELNGGRRVRACLPATYRTDNYGMRFPATRFHDGHLGALVIVARQSSESQS